MASPTIQFKRGAFTNLPDLKAGEPGFTTDKYDFYIGTEDAGASTNQFYGSGRYWEREDATTAARLKLVDKDGLNSISLQSANTLSGISTLILPNGGGADGEVLQIASGGGTGSYTLEWGTLESAPGGISVSDEGTPVGSASSVTRLNFVGEGVALAFTDEVSGVATVTVAQASTSQEGTASFTSADFGVASGVVSLNDAVVKSVSGDSGTATPASHSFGIIGGEGVDTSGSGANITISGEAASSTNAGIASYQSAQFYFEDTYRVGVVTATTAVKGIASFDATDFVVTSGDVAINDEHIQDIVGGMVTGNTETLITVTYQDGDGTIDFEVNNDLSQYSNATSAFITASSSDTLTNKTFDANGTGNSISNLEVADFAASGITTSGDTITSNDSDTQLPTSAAVIDYVEAEVGAIDLTLGIDADADGPSTVSTAQTLTVAGTANEIETSVSGQTITIGLPNDVTIGNDLTITGDLFVNGNTTQVNTTSLTVEDTLVELGIVDGNAPSSDVNRDLGILFNWYDTELRRAAVFWDDSVTRVAIAQSVTETASVLTVADYAAVEIGSLWVNDAAGASQVIRHNGTERILENITVDGGSF